MHGRWPPVEVREITVSGGTLPVERRGNGPPLILLHGWAMDRRVWHPLAEMLAGSHMLLMPDRRGFGAATAPPDLAMEGEDLLRIAHGFGIRHFALAGLSQGARIALAFAARAPTMLDAVIAIGAPLAGVQGTPDELAAGEAPVDPLRALWRAGALDAMRAAIAAHPLMQLVRPDAAPLLSAMIAGYDGRDLDMATSLGIGAADLAAIRVPALAITGGQEPVWRRRVGDVIAASIPAARRVQLSGAGHLSPLDQPAALAATIRQFLNEDR